MKDFNIGIDCENVKPDYKGGINTFIFGFLNGIINSKLQENYKIICTSKNISIFKKYSKKIGIIKIKNINFFQKIILTTLAIFNFKYLFYFFNKIFYKKTNFKLEKKITHIYSPTSIFNNYSIKTKKILSPHDIQHMYFPQNFNFFRLRYRSFHFRNSFAKSNLIQSSSNFIKKNILSKYKNINKNKIIVIKEGVDTKYFEFKSKNKKKNIVFFPAYYWPHKNHEFIISVFEKIIFKLNINCRLIMCGGIPGNNLNSFKTKMKKKFNKKIVHLGIINKNLLKNYYYKSKLILSPASYESNSLPILEAISCGSNVLASNIGPNIELSKRLSFKIFKLNDETSLIKNFLRIWQDNKLQKLIIKKNKTKILKFDWTNYTKEFHQFSKNIN